MGGITDPAQEFFKDGLWGWVTDQWKKLIGDAAGHLQVDVVESGLPTGAATSANQTTMITALQLIDDLRGALNSIHTDELDVVIDGQSADIEVTQIAAADLTPGVMGWDGTQWRKLPIVWGYSDRYVESLSEVNVVAGSHTLSFTAVPAGEVWVINGVSAFCSTANPADIQLTLRLGGSNCFLHVQQTVVGWQTELATGSFVLKEGDYVRVVFSTCILNDDIYAQAFGCKMKVAE